MRRKADFGTNVVRMDGTLVEPERYRWRVGRKVGRTIYACMNDTPSDEDDLIGVMDTRELAAEAVRAHNLDIDIRNSR